MGILDKKKKVFGNIAALRTLTEGFPKLSISNSFPSINNNGDAILFLTDLIKSLEGYEALVSTVSDTLIHALGDVEKEVKIALKQELKDIVSCGVDPSLPDFLKSTGTGITFDIHKVDFSNLMYVNPLSPEGNLLYNDVTPNLLNSSDFNTFLFQTIQNNGTQESWGSQTMPSNILNIRFDSVDITATNPNNTFTLKANAAYDNKRLTDFNNDYVDSLNLFNTEKMVNSIIDSTFGSITSILKTGIKQLQGEAKLGIVIDKMLNSTLDVVEDKVFEFTNQELQKSEIQAGLRREGVMILEGADKIKSKIPSSVLTTVNNNISTATTTEQKMQYLRSGLDTMANFSASNSRSRIDVPSIKLNFIQEMINKIIRSVINVLLSPKVLTIFIVNFKIIYGPNATFDDGIDFIRKNKTLVNNIMKRVSGLIIKRLLTIVLKKVAQIVAKSALKIQIEKAKTTKSQIASLVGVPAAQLRILKGLS